MRTGRPAKASTIYKVSIHNNGGRKYASTQPYTVDEDGKKHVPITIHFRSVDIVTVPDEEEIIAAMEEIRNNPTKVS